MGGEGREKGGEGERGKEGGGGGGGGEKEKRKICPIRRERRASFKARRGWC